MLLATPVPVPFRGSRPDAVRSRPPARPGPGPGRGRNRVRRPRGTDQTSDRSLLVSPNQPSTSAATSTTAASDEDRPALPRPLGRRSSLTTRAIALAVVFLILTISYASSLRIYFAQAEKIAATRAEITERSEAITGLKGKLSQWDDPAYVRLQARERLGWVVPGEIGFRVIGSDGKPLGGGAQITEPRATLAGEQDAWWLRLRRSLEAADRPAPAPGSAPAERSPSRTRHRRRLGRRMPPHAERLSP